MLKYYFDGTVRIIGGTQLEISTIARSVLIELCSISKYYAIENPMHSAGVKR
jgi:hypothetical protein